MSALDELIYDRTQSDVTYAAELNRKLGRGEALTAQELADWNAGLKGAYNATDMNRVDEAVRELGGMLTAAGYPVEYVDPRKLTSSSAGLPKEYTQVEYIESHGTEYIDTGFKPDSNTRVICEFMPLDSTKAYGIFGSRIAYQRSSYNLFVGDTGTHFQDDYNNTSTTNVEAVANTLYMIDKNKNVSTINDAQNSVAYSSFEVEYSMYLFGVNTSGAVNSAQLGALRMYSCSIYDNDILVRYYIPCTSSTGAVGLYDTVSGVFYTNVGTGSFTAGADVAPKPETDEWVVGDIINLPVWVQYIQNVRNIIEEYYIMTNSPELPEPTAPLTYDGANAIEKLIYDILKLYEGMIKRYRICGTFSAGSDYNRQYIRSV